MSASPAARTWTTSPASWRPAAAAAPTSRSMHAGTRSRDLSTTSSLSAFASTPLRFCLLTTASTSPSLSAPRGCSSPTVVSRPKRRGGLRRPGGGTRPRRGGKANAGGFRECVVKGPPRTVGPGAPLLELLGELALAPRRVVVEQNRRIVRRPALGETPVAAGDAIELV